MTLGNIYQTNRHKLSFPFNYVDGCSKNNYIVFPRYERSDNNGKYYENNLNTYAKNDDENILKASEDVLNL